MTRSKPPAVVDAYRVRAAQPTDVEAIVALIGALAAYEKLGDENHADAQQLAEHLFGARPYAEALIAESADGSAVGYALYFHTYSTFLTKPGLYLEDLFVEVAHRGRGCGKALLRELAQTALKRGCGRLEWAVLDWNEPALGFYRSIGAAPVDGWTVYRLSGERLAGFARG